MSPLGIQVGVGFGAGGETAAVGKALSALKEICYYHGWGDRSSGGEAALARFINRTLQLLAALAPWPEYNKRDGNIAMADGTNYYALSENNILKIGSVVRSGRSVPLNEITVDQWLLKTTTQSVSGPPTEYALRKYVSSEGVLKMEMLVSPNPSSGVTLYYTYETLPVELVVETDKTDWPTYRLWLLEEALEKRIASGKRDNVGVALESPEFMALVRKSIMGARTSYMPMTIHPIKRPRDMTIREMAFGSAS